MSEAEDGLARALRSVLADHGRRVTEHPERVRALLSDALGARSREWRADIDALVLAAEERVPATVTAAVTDTGMDGDDEVLVRTLTQRGLTVEMARTAIDLWRSALTEGASAPAARAGSRAGPAWERPGAAAPVTGASPTTAPPPVAAPPAPAAPPPAPAPAPHRGSRPGATAAAYAEPVAATEIPLGRGVPASPPPGIPNGPPAGMPTGPPPGPGPGAPVGEPPRPGLFRVPGSSSPKVVTMSRGRAMTLGGAALAAALVVGGIGARQLDPPPKAALVAATPTVSTSTVTSTSVETVTVTAAPQTVKSTVVIDASKLRAVNLSGTTTTYVTYAGSAGCVLKPKRGTAYRACFTWDTVEATGSVKSWKLTSARVISGTGTASIEGKRINYHYNRNGPYTAKVRYTIEGGGYFSTGVYTFAVQCNPSFACKQSLPL